MPRPSDVLAHRNRTVANREKHTLAADVYYPESPAATEIAETTASSAAESTRSLVVYVYGDVQETGSTSQFARWTLDATDRGFVAAEVSYRLEREASFPVQIEDVCKSIDWLTDRVDELGVDTDAVAVIDHPVETHLALLAAFSDSRSSYQADTDATVGVSDVYSLRADDHKHVGGSLPLPENRSPVTKLCRCLSIIYVDDNIDVDADASSTLLLHGGEDSAVAPGRSARLVGAPEEAGTQVEYDAVDTADHVFLHSSYHYLAVRKRVLSFPRESL